MPWQPWCRRIVVLLRSKVVQRSLVLQSRSLNTLQLQNYCQIYYRRDFSSTMFLVLPD